MKKYHLQGWKDKAIIVITKYDAIEEHLPGTPDPCISNIGVIPKNDVFLRLTLDASNIHKTKKSTNLQIPRQKVKLKSQQNFLEDEFYKCILTIWITLSLKIHDMFLWQQ